MAARSLSELFLDAAPASVRPALQATPGLEAQLQALLQTVKRAHPALGEPPETFLAYLAGRVGAQLNLEQLHVTDLYFAHACVLERPAALEQLEVSMDAAVGSARRWLRGTSESLDEVKQLLMTTLLVGVGDAPPAIRQYSGRGSLPAFLRATALRVASNLRRRSERASDEAAEPEVPFDPELSWLAAQYRPDFEAAFTEALQSLPTRERNALRLHLLEGLSLEETGRIYSVHRATVARWVAAGRERVFDETRRRLAARLGAPTEEVDSLLRVLRDRLEISIRRYLKDSPT